MCTHNALFLCLRIDLCLVFIGCLSSWTIFKYLTCSSACLSVCPSVLLFALLVFDCLSVYLSVCFVCLSVLLFAYLSSFDCLSVCLFVCLSVLLLAYF